MHIVVTLKQVFDSNTPQNLLRIGANGKSLESIAGLPPVLNGYDANALEEAIRLKEKVGGTITVLSVGDEQVKAHLRRAIAMGADKAIHVNGAGGLESDSYVAAARLAGVIRKLQPIDLVLCGRSASDTDGGQVLFILAEMLGLSAVSPIKKISDCTSDSITCERIAESGTQLLQARFPVLLGISSETNTPRSPSLKGVMVSKKTEIPSLGDGDLEGALPPPALALRRLYFEIPMATSAEIIGGDSPAAAGRNLADRLFQEGLIP